MAEPVSEAVQAALAREDLTPLQRRRLAARIKAVALRDRIASFPQEKTWTLPNGATVTVEGLTLAGDDLRFHLTVLRPNGSVYFEDDVVVVNPPVLVPDGDVPNPDYDPGDPDSPERVKVYREDIRGALRAIVADTVRSAVRRSQ